MTLYCKLPKTFHTNRAIRAIRVVESECHLMNAKQKLHQANLESWALMIQVFLVEILLLISGNYDALFRYHYCIIKITHVDTTIEYFPVVISIRLKMANP